MKKCVSVRLESEKVVDLVGEEYGLTVVGGALCVTRPGKQAFQVECVAAYAPGWWKASVVSAVEEPKPCDAITG